MFNEHSKWSSPVANVVFTHRGVANKVQHAHQGIANNCGPQMAYVHFLCNVRRRIVNNNGFFALNAAYAKST